MEDYCDIKIVDDGDDWCPVGCDGGWDTRERTGHVYRLYEALTDYSCVCVGWDRVEDGCVLSLNY